MEKIIKKLSKYSPETYQIAKQNHPNIYRKSVENQSTFDNKSTKNQSNIHQNHHYENPSKIDQKSIKNRPKSQKCRGAPGLPRDNFASKWRPERKIHALRLGSHLGCVLEASWARLGGQDRSKLVPNRRKIDKKSMQKSIKNSMPSKFQFLCNFDRFLERKRRHVGTKIGSKIDANFERRFFEKTWFYLSENHYFEGFGGRS